MNPDLINVVLFGINIQNDCYTIFRHLCSWLWNITGTVNFEYSKLEVVPQYETNDKATDESVDMLMVNTVPLIIT